MRTAVLVMSADPIVREAFSEILRPNGYTVLGAADDEEAWRLFEEERPRAVLLDGKAPPALASRVKAACQDVGVIWVTSSLPLERAGACDVVLRKPVSHGQLVVSLAQIGAPPPGSGRP